MGLLDIGRRERGPNGTDAPGADGGGETLRVFVTGATGYIGRAIVRELVEAGHEVAGLTRWAEKTLRLDRLGARAVVGDIRDSLSFRKVAAEYDVLIHLASDPSDDRPAADRAAVQALLWAARQREDRPKDAPPRSVIYTSGCWVLGDTGDAPAGEDASTAGSPELVAWRPPHEQQVLDANDDEVAAAVIRPGMVYGGRGGLIGSFFASADEEGEARYVGGGANRWSPVYRGSVARLYRMVAERRARGVYHCTEDDAVPVAELARAASEAAGAGGAVRSVPVEQARERMGAVADALVLDQVVVSPRAHELGWRHEHPPFVESAADLYREWREAGATNG